MHTVDEVYCKHKLRPANFQLHFPIDYHTTLFRHNIPVVDILVVAGTRAVLVVAGTRAALVVAGTRAVLVVAGTRAVLVVAGTRAVPVVAGTRAVLIAAGGSLASHCSPRTQGAFPVCRHLNRLWNTKGNILLRNRKYLPQNNIWTFFCCIFV